MRYEGLGISSIKPNIAINIERLKNNKETQKILKRIENFSVSKQNIITQKIQLENHASYIIIKINVINRPVKLLIDTGASLSIIAKDLVTNKIKIEDFRINLFGISGKEKSITTNGLVQCMASIDNCQLGTTLHILDRKYLGNIDGILGFDFLYNYNAVIDIKNSEIKFRLDEWNEIKNEENKSQIEDEILKHLMKNYDFDEETSVKNNHEKTRKENNGINTDGEKHIELKYDLKIRFGIDKKERDKYEEYIEAVDYYENQFDRFDKFKVKRMNEDYGKKTELNKNELIINKENKMTQCQKKIDAKSNTEITNNKNELNTNMIDNENIKTKEINNISENENLILEMDGANDITLENTEKRDEKSEYELISENNSITNELSEVNECELNTRENDELESEIDDTNEITLNCINDKDEISKNELISKDKSITNELFEINECEKNKRIFECDTLYNESKRSKIVFDSLKLDNCNDEEKQMVRELCRDFEYQFYMEGDILGCTDVIRHEIRLIPNSKLVNVRQYRIPHAHKQILQNILDEYERQNIIEKCQSSYNSPVILVGKKDDNNEKTDFRLVMDFSKLNEQSEKLNFPIPLVEDIMDGLSGCRIFTTLDIKGAFHQIMLEDSSRDCTAFSTGSFKYRWVRMPMGLSSSPLTWQRAINTVLADLMGKGVYVYLDDVIICAKNKLEHDITLQKVMILLRNNNLQLKISKCNFYAKKFIYLGHIVSERGISPNPRKIEAIRDFPRPTNVKQVQSFHGLANYYRRFIKNFAHMAKPLTVLTRKEQPFIWNETTQIAFETLKKILIEEVILEFPNFDLTFYVTTDASDVAVGAVLSQGEIPNDRPLQFFSRTLNDAQKRYSVIQKELLAIVEAIRAFRPYLYGRFFVLITDHKPLCYLFNMKDCGSRLFRQRIELLDYNFKVLHRAGSQNFVADALSRMEPLSLDEMLKIENKKEECRILTRAQAREEMNMSNDGIFTILERDGTILKKHNFDLLFHLVPTENDVLKEKLINKFAITNFSNNWYNFKKIHYAILISNQFSFNKNEHLTDNCIKELFKICKEKNVETIAINVDYDAIRHYIYLKSVFSNIFRTNEISITFFLNKILDLIEEDDIITIMDLYHRSLLGGHIGIERMQKTVSKFYKWENMNKTIENYVKNCSVCEKTKYTGNTKIPMGISSLGEILFDHTYIDFVGPINPPSILGHKYIFTAICDLTKYMIAVPTIDCSAITTAECLLENILLRYNFPSKIISDNASNFNSKVIRELLKMLQIKKNFTTPYHPQSNIVERGHRTLNAYLRAYTEKNKEIWHDLLKFAMFAYNNSIHSVTNYTPHELAHGFKIKIPNSLSKPKILYNYDNLADVTRKNITNALQIAKEKLNNRKITNKNYYDKNTKELNINVGDRILIRTQNKKEKFQNVYEGPYEVVEIYEYHVQILKDGKITKIHKNMIKKSFADYDNEIFPIIELDNNNIQIIFK